MPRRRVLRPAGSVTISTREYDMNPVSSDLDSFQPRFGGWFAKVEVFLGLFAAAVGFLLSHWGMGTSLAQCDPFLTGIATALFILGGYLALAGQRSHIYRSVMESEKSLRTMIQRL